MRGCWRQGRGKRGCGGWGGQLLLRRDRNAMLHTRGAARAARAGVWWASAGRYICSIRLMNGVGTPSDKHDKIPNYGSTFKALKLWKYSLHPRMLGFFFLSVSSATHTSRDQTIVMSQRALYLCDISRVVDPTQRLCPLRPLCFLFLTAGPTERQF